MGARDALDDRQAEAGAGRAAARRVEPGERPLQALGFAARDAGAAVAHLDRRFPALVRQFDLDRLAGIAQRVVDQVADRAAHRHAGEAESAAASPTFTRDLLAQARVVLADLVEQRRAGPAAIFSSFAPRAKSRNWPMMASISSMSVAIARAASGLGAAHLEREAQARERRAQVVRDARRAPWRARAPCSRGRSPCG